jgi:hypothetical protein
MYLEKNQVPDHLRRGYSGTRFKAEPVESVTIPAQAGVWDHGTRDVYSAIELNTGRSVPMPNQSSAPWDKDRQDRKIELKQGFAVVKHSMFCGNDMGLTFFVHPADVAALIPHQTNDDLSDTDKIILAIIRSRKSAYRNDEYRRKGLKLADVETVKARLTEQGYLLKNGAITVKGKNACDKIYV